MRTRYILSLFVASVVSVCAVGRAQQVLYYTGDQELYLGQARRHPLSGEIVAAYGVPDVSSYGNVGHFNPVDAISVGVEPGRVGYALSFPGIYKTSESTTIWGIRSDANRVWAGGTWSLELSGGSSTIAFWMKPDPAIFGPFPIGVPITVHGIIGQGFYGAVNTVNDGWMIHFLSEPGSAYFKVANRQGAAWKEKEFWQGSPLAAWGSVWTHVAFVQDAGSGTLTLYLNGVAFGSNSGWLPLDDTPMPLVIGTSLEHGAWSRDYKGLLDEIRIYRFAMSAEDVGNLANTPEYVALNCGGENPPVVCPQDLIGEVADLQAQLDACLNPPCPTCEEVGAAVDAALNPPASYKNHGQYVSAVAHKADELLANTDCTAEEAEAIHSCVVSARAKQ